MSSTDAYATGYFTTDTFSIFNKDGTLSSLPPLQNTGDLGASTKCVYLIKYNPEGFALWAAMMGTTDNKDAKGSGVSVDVNGNCYVTGDYYGNLTIYNSNGSSFANTLPYTDKSDVNLTEDPASALTLVNSVSNVYVVKYSPNGTVLWVTYMESTISADAYSISVDNAGNSYICGKYNGDMTTYDSNGTIAFPYILQGYTPPPPIVKTDLRSYGFLVKYNTQGKTQWVTRVKSDFNNYNYGTFGLSVDKSGNCYITGGYINELTIYDANGTTPFYATLQGYPDNSTANVFIAKYNSSGKTLWVTRMVMSDSSVYGSSGISITSDPSGNCYVTGIYSANLIIYDSNGTSAFTPSLSLDTTGDGLPYNAFLVKYSPEGKTLWVTRITQNILGLNVSADMLGNCYVTGFYYNELTLYDSNGTTAFSPTLAGNDANQCVFLAKYNTEGKTVWATRMISYIPFISGNTQGICLSTDILGNCYVTGYYIGSDLIIYDSNGTQSNTLPYTNPGDNLYNIFIVKYDADGKSSWATHVDSALIIIIPGEPPFSHDFKIACNRFLYVPIHPISNICFTAGTHILLDQGELPIEEINPEIHTICHKEIVAVTKTFTNDPYLIQIEKGALRRNVPDKKTIVSAHHLIYFDGIMSPAHTLVPEYAKKVPYNDELLYNVLMKEHSIMNANGLCTETLHPDNPVAQAFKKKSKFISIN